MPCPRFIVLLQLRKRSPARHEVYAYPLPVFEPCRIEGLTEISPGFAWGNSTIFILLYCPKKILVTGANGFVGSALGNHLRNRHFPVCLAVRTLQAEDTASGRFVEVGDIGPETDWSLALRNVNTVVFLAARVHVMKEQAADSLAAFCQVNVQGTLGLARQAVNKGIRRFIFLSTIKVNGEYTSETPFRENDVPDPQDYYSQSKFEAERRLWEIASETGLEVVVVRCPLVYGPQVKANFLRLLQWVDRGIPLPLGCVKNRRSLIFIGNLVDCLISCIAHPSAPGETFLVSDGEDLSTPELIKRMALNMGRSACLLPIPEKLLYFLAKLSGKTAEIDKLCGSLQVNIQKAESLLGWKPPFTVDEGLRETVSWYAGRNR